MKSTPLHAGNVNLRGKKQIRLRCRCCSAVDMRDKEIKRIHMKEIRNGG